MQFQIFPHVTRTTKEELKDIQAPVLPLGLKHSEM